MTGWLDDAWRWYGNHTTLPMWAWRPVCWITGQHRGGKRWHNNRAGACVYCRKSFDP